MYLTDCPIAELNNIFPNGIPLHPEPVEALNEECLELNLSGLADDTLAAIGKICMSDTVPVALAMSILVNGAVFIPKRWLVSDVQSI